MKTTVRNFLIEQNTEEIYKHGFISAWKEVWEEYDEEKDKWNKRSQIICHLKREKFLSLGMDGYISKPINSEELKTIFNIFLSTKELIIEKSIYSKYNEQ